MMVSYVDVAAQRQHPQELTVDEFKSWSPPIECEVIVRRSRFQGSIRLFHLNFFPTNEESMRFVMHTKIVGGKKDRTHLSRFRRDFMFNTICRCRSDGRQSVAHLNSG